MTKGKPSLFWQDRDRSPSRQELVTNKNNHQDSGYLQAASFSSEEAADRLVSVYAWGIDGKQCRLTDANHMVSGSGGTIAS